jgi:transcriptional regulator with XRE-family HTH domain
MEAIRSMPQIDGRPTLAFKDDFKDRLNVAFARSGLTLAQFAKGCNVSVPTAWRWLDRKNSVTPELKKMGLVCGVLRVSAAYLIQGDRTEEPRDDHRAEARELVRRLSAILDNSPEDPGPKGRGGKVKPT